ncbi:DUF2523 domain-containing protein [Vibrio diabolicus]|uniref:DUF2523 family protein n=1 Tax=Vibrio harveyi group TaxID=717610 RepID=UPI0004706494|nr:MULTISPECIES: DUF2523 family protein [Vibrio harveyi group]KHF13343.1 hypothetical protein PO80_18725 [Vibrio parahaemolyticus]MCS0338228.1 DUF2523 domain-containing protein [Vibrio diabolicus]MDZ5119563.1 DUF2523 family protein [Vibrio parahaemolyticus]OTV93743.1 hypothetical protein BA740_12900 [Vibrio parahaemolyticus]OTV93752.1 hypothetical protein BA740_12945 [Vibrio parahaemolyticus]
MLNFIVDIWNSFLSLVASIFLSAYDMLCDLGCLAFDSVMSLGVNALNAAGSSLNFISIVPYIDYIPQDYRDFLAYVGFNQALSMVITALLIRFVMQAIPFVGFGRG